MRRLLAVSIAIFALAPSHGLQASPIELDTISNNFLLSGGGGGASALLAGSLNVEIFNADFANDIFVPHNGYSAVLTSLTSSGFAAGTPRFGDNTSWRTVVITDDAVDGGSDDAAD